MSHVTLTSKQREDEAIALLRKLGEEEGDPDKAAFLNKCVVYEYPRPSVAVDLVIYGLNVKGSTLLPSLKVLLIKRGHEPFAGHWAIPGGFVNENEDLEVAAMREAREETHVEPAFIEQVGVYGTLGRDPRGHVIGVAYMALVDISTTRVQADDDADDAVWYPVNDLPKNLAFDHEIILRDALAMLRKKLPNIHCWDVLDRENNIK